MQAFRHYIQQYSSLPDSEWDAITACLHPLLLPANEVLLREGEICRHLYFAEKGLLRFFFWREGEEVTRFLTQAPYLFTSQRSFSEKVPSSEGIATLTPCQLLRMSTEDAFRLLEGKAWNTFIRKLLQEVQSNTQALYTEAQTLTAEVRYRNMMEEQPQLLQQVPQKYLASYLGIAPQSLSRIRKKIAKEDQAP